METTLMHKVIGISIGLFVAAVMLPMALLTLSNATWGRTNPAVVTIITVLLPVLAVIGIALYFIE